MVVKMEVNYRTSMDEGRFWLGEEEIAIADFSSRKACRRVAKDLAGIVDVFDEEDDEDMLFISGKANHDKARKKGYVTNSERGDEDGNDDDWEEDGDDDEDDEDWPRDDEE